MMASNELNKARRVLDTLEQCLPNQKVREVKEDLRSVKMLLELLLNDRESMKQHEASEQDYLDLEKNTA